MVRPQEQAALAEIRDLILQVEGERVREIILHGSRASGRARAASDFDVLVVVVGPVEDWVERSMQLRSLFYDRDYEVDVQVFGEVEYDESNSVPGTLPYPAHTSGIRLYENSRGSPRADGARVGTARSR